MLGTTKSSAILQANPTTHKSPVSKHGVTWLTQIRQMETTGQTMGLDETLEGLNATEENGIDVHMMLPTEYGAVAILSASGYGNPEKLLDEADAQKRTTTGNATGVYFTGNRWELTASAGTNKYCNNNLNAVGSITKFFGPSGWHGGSWSGSEQIPGSSNGKSSYRAGNLKWAGDSPIFETSGLGVLSCSTIYNSRENNRI